MLGFDAFAQVPLASIPLVQTPPPPAPPQPTTPPRPGAPPLTIANMTSIGALAGTELFPIVSPGNNAQTNRNFSVTARVIANSIAVLSGLLPVNLASSATVTGVLN